jgi:hypothetical protein
MASVEKKEVMESPPENDFEETPKRSKSAPTKRKSVSFDWVGVSKLGSCD